MSPINGYEPGVIYKIYGTSSNTRLLIVPSVLKTIWFSRIILSIIFLDLASMSPSSADDKFCYSAKILLSGVSSPFMLRSYILRIVFLEAS
jgi:hypothetical protein